MLVVNGVNYDFCKHVFATLLSLFYCVIIGSFCGEYDKKYVFNTNEPILYHNCAILLSDARVSVYDGITALTSIDINAHLDLDGE